MQTIEPEILDSLIYDMVKHNSLFIKLINFSKIYFDDSTSTAYVKFDKTDFKPLHIGINQIFWENSSDEFKKFILTHEILHVVLDHGRRTALYKSIYGTSNKLMNIACDICVNRDCVDIFGFKKEYLDPNNTFIWGQNIFDNWDDIKNSNMEFFASILVDIPDERLLASTVDEHQFIENATDQSIDAPTPEIDDILADIRRSLIETQPQIFSHNEKNTPVKKSLNNLIVTCSYKELNKLEVKKENWIFKPRRFINGNFFLPSEYDETHPAIKRKCNLLVFMDSSGSCVGVLNKIYNIALSIDKNKFNTEIFSFDTQVYPVVNGNIKGGGGTRFSCITEYLQKNKTKYDLIFVVTDGFGGDISIHDPHKWVFMISDFTKNKTLLRNLTNKRVFDLDDFE